MLAGPGGKRGDHGASPSLTLPVNEAVPLRITVERICRGEGSIDELHAHIARGMHPDDDASGGTPLLIAAFHGQKECLEALLCSGADPNFAGRTEVNLTNRGAAAALDMWMNGTVTPLYVAAQHGHGSCVSQLILARAHVDCEHTKDGSTPLYASCSHGHSDCVARLLSAGADVQKACRDGATPLAACCRQGHGECARLLCERGASIDSPDRAGNTPMMLAFTYVQTLPSKSRVEVCMHPSQPSPLRVRASGRSQSYAHGPRAHTAAVS